MKIWIISRLFAFVLLTFAAINANATLITFDFTGRLTVGAPGGFPVINDSGLTYAPIAASLSFDTDTGLGVSNLSVTTGTSFVDSVPTFHDISMSSTTGNLLEGTVLVDWSDEIDIPLHVEWDATGLYTAIAFGLQVGDTISGTNLIRNGITIANVNSAIPYADIIPLQTSFQGPAPLAATFNSIGITAGSLTGFHGYFDIGSGNSLHVTSINSVPIPTAFWLFASGLLGLIKFSGRFRNT